MHATCSWHDELNFGTGGNCIPEKSEDFGGSVDQLSVIVDIPMQIKSDMEDSSEELAEMGIAPIRTSYL
jgi:hypothetical protein